MNEQSAAIATGFYASFQQKDAQAMNKFYHHDLEFHDPAFGHLSYAQATAMWSMLCDSAKDLSITFEVLKAEENYVETKWIADYNFSKTSRQVKNEIIASMHIKEGLIVKHDDAFNLHRWAKQALGIKGFLLGGTNFFRKKLLKQTGGQLKKYMAKNR